MGDRVERKDRRLIHEGSCLRVYSDTMVFPNGHTEEWDMVEHMFNAAAVLPILPNGNVILVRQFRSACDRYTWEIPAGKRDDDGKEDPFICAARELKEETGYSSDNIEHLMTLRLAVAYSTEELEVYIARDIYPDGGQSLDEGEDINIKEWNVNELRDMIFKGEIQDSKTVAAILSVFTLQ